MPRNRQGAPIPGKHLILHRCSNGILQAIMLASAAQGWRGRYKAGGDENGVSAAGIAGFRIPRDLYFRLS